MIVLLVFKPWLNESESGPFNLKFTSLGIHFYIFFINGLGDHWLDISLTKVGLIFSPDRISVKIQQAFNRWHLCS